MSTKDLEDTSPFASAETPLDGPVSEVGEESQDVAAPPPESSSGDDAPVSTSEGEGGEASPSGAEDWDFKTFIAGQPAARGRVVPREAYERQKAQIAAAREAQRRFEERFDALLKRTSGAPTAAQGAPTAAQGEAPTAPADPVQAAMQTIRAGLPAPAEQFKDPTGYAAAVEAYNEAQRILLDERQANEARSQEQRKQEELESAADAALAQSVGDAMVETPDWAEAAAHYERAITSVIGAMPQVAALPASRRAEAVSNQFRGIVRDLTIQAARTGQSPAAVIYGMAQQLGYQPASAPAPTPAPAPAAAPPSSPPGAPQASERFKTLSAAGSGGSGVQSRGVEGITFRDMWSMTDAEWEKIEASILS